MMEPPPNVPLLSDFPDYISLAFEKCFGREGVQERPKAEKWVLWLEQLEKELQQCSSNSAHHHVKGRPCPWCRMELANPGFVAFSSSQPLRVIPINVDTTQFAALINSVKNPGPIVDLNSVVAVPANLTISASASAIVATLKVLYGASLGASIVGLLLLQSGVATIVGLLLCGAGMLVSFYPYGHEKKIAEAKREAESAWRVVGDAWSRQPGNKEFIEAKKKADALLRDLSELPAEEKQKMHQLERKKRDVQLSRFLERFQIKAAKIRKIGSGRKAVLASFGVETAADIEQHRLTPIQGFGPALISELVMWRKGVEKKFVFNDREPISPVDIATLKTAIASQKAGLETKLRSSIDRLQQVANLASDQRKSLTTSANVAFAKLKQAELDERSTHPIFGRVSKIVSASCLVLALLDLRSTPNSPTPPRATVQASKPVIVKQPEVDGLHWPPNGQMPPTNVTIVPRNPDAAPKDSDTADRGGDQPTSALPSAPVPVQEGGDTVTRPVSPSPPPLQIPPTVSEIGEKESTPPLDRLPKLDITRASDVMQIQQRLLELGYLSTPPDGKWGPRSARSLQDFRSANRIDGDSAWDRATEALLFGSDAIRAAIGMTFIGGWTADAGLCGASGEGPPLRITSTHAETASGRCDFDSVRLESEGTWRVVARCNVSGATWVANIELRISANRLIWSSEKGRAQYYRC
jgi:Putative peptidoglycan binding domain